MYLNNSFYEIKSRKSSEIINGVRQVSLCSEIYDNIQCFLWLNEKDQLKHLQLIFDENILEWFDDREFTGGATNRKLTPSWKTGLQKGVRTIHDVPSDANLKIGIELLKTSLFPSPYLQIIKDIVRPKFCT